MKNAIVGAALLLLSSQVAMADVGRLAFSADVTVQKHNQVVSSGKFWVDADKTRFDVQAKGHNVSSIMRMDKKVMYMVMVDRHMYMEQAMPDPGQGGGAGPGQGRGPIMNSNRADATITLIGPDTINGQACDKYSISVKGKIESYEWRAKGQLIPVREATADMENITDFTNVHTGPQDPSVFEPPAGFQKFDMSGLPGGMMPGGPPPGP